MASPSTAAECRAPPTKTQTRQSALVERDGLGLLLQLAVVLVAA